MRFFRLVLLALVPLGLAQSTGAGPSSGTPSTTNSSAPAAPTVPPCAAKCLAIALLRSYCSSVVPASEQTKCACSNQDLQLDVTKCVVANCTVKESIRFQGLSKAKCGEAPRDLSQRLFIVTIFFAAVAWSLVLSRIGFKYFALGAHELGMDDLFIFLTACVTIPSATITFKVTLPNGLGKDIWALPIEQIYIVLEYFFGMTILYFLEVGMLKMSLLFFYLRIFPAKGVKRILWGTVIVNVVVTIVFIILDAVQCSPISLFWTRWDGEHSGTCIMEINDIAVANAVISIALDVWMLAVPIWQLRSLQLNWKKKIGVAAMFAVGTLFTVLSCIRLEILVRVGKHIKNPTFEELEISIMSAIEITVGIICACMPTFRMLLVRLFPRLGNVTSRNYGSYGSGGGPGGARHGSGYGKGSRSRSNGPSDALRSGGSGGGHIALKDLKTVSATSSAVRSASPAPPSSIPAGTIRMQTDYTVTSAPQSPMSRSGLHTREGDLMRDEYDDESRLVIMGNTPSPQPLRRKGSMV